MPNDNPQIVTGMREPHHTGQVMKPMSETHVGPSLRRQQLREGQVEFHSINKRYRVEFAQPKQQLNTATGEVIQEGPRFLQFEGYICIVENPHLIHQAKGCVNIPEAMIPHKHTDNCSPKGCKIMRCAMGHQNPVNPTQLYYPTHPSCHVKGDFWDARDHDTLMAKSTKARIISEMQNLKNTVPPEEMPEFLAALGIDAFQLPPKEASK